MFFKINLKNIYKGRDIMDISLTTYYFGRRSVIFSESLNAIPYWSMSESHKQIKMRKPAYKYPQQLQSLTVFLAKTLMPLTYRSKGNFERVVWDPSDSSKKLHFNWNSTNLAQSWTRLKPVPKSWHGNGSGHCTLQVHTMKRSFHHWNNLCKWLKTCKDAPETVLWI